MALEDMTYKGDGRIRRSKGTVCTAEEGKTRQSEKDQADINKILARLDQRELSVSAREGIYADVSGITDFRDAMEKVQRGQEAFSSLDARVRNAFANDPAEFLDAFATPDGLQKLRDLGVIPETEEVLEDRREAAAEARAVKRREARELAARLEAARTPPK